MTKCFFYVLGFCISVLFVSCSEQTPTLVGVWKVEKGSFSFLYSQTILTLLKDSTGTIITDNELLLGQKGENVKWKLDENNLSLSVISGEKNGLVSVLSVVSISWNEITLQDSEDNTVLKFKRVGNWPNRR